MGQRGADHLGRVHVVLGEEVRDAVAPVDLRAAELERGDLLARDALDHGRAGEEHLRVVAGHDREVAQRRRVRRAAGARAADHADLRHLGQGLRAEDRAVGVQRADALLQARAARVREAHDRDAELVGVLDRAGDRLAAADAQRAALEGAVLRPGADDAPVDAAGARQHAVAHERAGGAEAAGIEEQLETRSGDEMLRGDIEYSAHALLTARHAFCPPNPKEFDRASSSPGASRGPSGT